MPSPDPQPGDPQPPPPASGDVYTDAARELSERSSNPRQEALDADRDVERAASSDVDADDDAADPVGATPPA